MVLFLVVSTQSPLLMMIFDCCLHDIFICLKISFICRNTEKENYSFQTVTTTSKELIWLRYSSVLLLLKQTLKHCVCAIVKKELRTFELSHEKYVGCFC